MDVKHQTTEDCRRSRSLVVSVVFFLLVAHGTCSAQGIAIRAARGDPEADHAPLAPSTAFPEVSWDVHNSLTNDVLVVWSLEPFQLQKGPSKQRSSVNSGLSLRLIQGSSGSWQVSQATDQTHVLKNDLAATVSAVGRHQGEATFGLVVGFLPEPNTLVAAGEYSSRLTGTITSP